MTHHFKSKKKNKPVHSVAIKGVSFVSENSGVNQLYQALTETFSPKQMLETVNELNVKDWMKSRSWVQSVIESWIFNGRVERVKRGLYQKTNQQKNETL